MVEKLHVESIRTFISFLIDKHGEIPFACASPDTPESPLSSFTLFLSAPWMDNTETRLTLSSFVYDLREFFGSEGGNVVSRISILKSNDPFILNLNLLNIEKSSLSLNNVTVNEMSFDEFYIFENYMTAFKKSNS